MSRRPSSSSCASSSTRSRLAVVWGGSFAFFFSFFLLLSALPLYARDLALSDAEIGIVMAAFAVSSMVLRPWAGWVADRHGRRALMLAGGAVFVLAPLGYGLGGTVLSLGLVRLLHGAGMGLYPTAATAMVADLAPPTRRAEIMGLFGMASGLALALGPVIGVAVARALGFGLLFVIAAGIGALGFALTTTAPETLGAPSRAPFRFSTTLSRAAVLPSGLMLCLTLTYGALITFLPLHADTRGLNPGVFFLVYALALTAVRQPAGRISDRRGRAPVAAAGLLTVTVALLVLASSDGVTGLVAAGLVYGIGHGTAHTVLLAWCVDGVTPAERGRAVGTCYTALELGIAIGSVAAGVAVARAGFAATFVAAAVVTAGAALVAVTRRR